MSNVPEAREILREVKAVLGNHPRPLDLMRCIARLDDAIEMMTRRPHKTDAPRKSRRMTPGMAPGIKAYAAAHPTLNQAEIGAHFNVASGRVSEALHGDWDVGGVKWVAFMGQHKVKDAA